MADAEPTPPGPNVQGALPWLRWAQTVNQETQTSITPFLGDDEELREYLADVDGIDKELYVLNNLQSTRPADFAAPALQIILNSLVDTLPQAIQDRVGLHLGKDYWDPDTGPVIGQPIWFTQEDGQFQKTLDLFRNGLVASLDSNNKEFILWVVDAGTPTSPYYATIVLCYGPSDPSKPEVLDRITDWAIIDARDVKQKPESTERTANRVLELLRDRIPGATRHHVWLPPFQPGVGEEGLSAFIAYSAVSQLLTRIGTMHCAENINIEKLFVPLQPWLNPNAIRAEALGRTAIKTMEKLKWKARLAVFPIDPYATAPLRPWGPVATHRPPVTETTAATVTDPLFGDYGGHDNSTQTAEVPAPTTDDSLLTNTQESSAEIADTESEIVGGPFAMDVPPPSSSSSSTDPDGVQWTLPKPASPKPKTLEGDLIEIYYEHKFDELKRARQESERTREVCLDAQQFAERLHYEVLEAPVRSIPTAYAVERLFWLVRRAIERSRYVAEFLYSLEQKYTNDDIHYQVEERLSFPEVREEFEKWDLEYKEIYTAADEILNNAYAARSALSPTEELGEPLEEEIDYPNVNEGGDGGHDSSSSSSSEADVEDDINVDVDVDVDVEPAPSKLPHHNSNIPKKRRYTEAATSALDEDGEEVFTMTVSTAKRPQKKQKKQKTPAKKSKKSKK
ncbi:hypothetical protein E0Z10_g4060 [Xylaria hypoxylon]|uniref:Uncharacterized protein n=1 Tax=Xylaria hypoxylon TaxID=37992 RepID=A0A4Z0Z862_9PEZI|nr:hypothetical protein E0Z10_g4060 [Xylaria hypoxylon]